MAERAYFYEYETSPRKLKPEYDRDSYKVPQAKKKVALKESKNANLKVNKKVQTKFPMKMLVYIFAVFVVLLAWIYTESKVYEAFSKIQSLKTEMSKIQKENDQLEIGIQNSLNLNNIEQAAKEMLGMQKLTNKQIVYINLRKEDYVLPTTETVIIEDNTTLLTKVVNFIKDVI